MEPLWVHVSFFFLECFLAYVWCKSMDPVISELCYKGTILQRNPRKMSFLCSHYGFI